MGLVGGLIGAAFCAWILYAIIASAVSSGVQRGLRNRDDWLQDRDALVEVLRTRLAEGKLDQADFDRWLSNAMETRTARDVDHLLTKLP